MDGCGCEPGFEIFDRRTAESDIERYRRHGPDETTRLLLDMIRERGVQAATVLDIGGGVGVIDHELLKAGAGHATMVDASAPSLEAARNEARRRGHLDRVEFMDGDFVSRAAAIDPADIVTLDRVVCCYPDARALIGRSAAKARRLYGLVHPVDRWWTRLVATLGNLGYRLFRNPYRIHVHRQRLIDELVEDAGLRSVDIGEGWFWRTAVYRRVRPAGAAVAAGSVQG
jgi:magnesium-protoporphyrin O-methyltransferase